MGLSSADVGRQLPSLNLGRVVLPVLEADAAPLGGDGCPAAGKDRKQADAGEGNEPLGEVWIKTLLGTQHLADQASGRPRGQQRAQDDEGNRCD